MQNIIIMNIEIFIGEHCVFIFMEVKQRSFSLSNTIGISLIIFL